MSGDRPAPSPGPEEAAVAADPTAASGGEGTERPEPAPLGEPAADTPDGERGVDDPAVADDAGLADAERDTTQPIEAGAEPDEAALRLAEALIFSAAEPVSPAALRRLLPAGMAIEAVISALTERYAGRGIELIAVAGGVMFRTAADLAPRLRTVIEVPRRLPRVAMETLAIIAYHQPMTRPEIEHLRGSALSQQTLDSLLELNLIAPQGRRETPGRPTLWGTTPAFLAYFGLKDIRELPRREDLLLEPVQAHTVPAEVRAAADERND